MTTVDLPYCDVDDSKDEDLTPQDGEDTDDLEIDAAADQEVALQDDFEDIEVGKASKLPYLVGAGIVALVIGLVFYGSMAKSPNHELAAIAKAFQDQNRVQFLEQVALERVLDQSLPVLLGHLLRDEQFGKDYGEADRDLIEDTLYFALQQKIDRWFHPADGADDLSVTPAPLLKAVNLWLDPLLAALDPSQAAVQDFEVGEREAQLRVDLLHPVLDHKFSFEFRLERNAHGWRLVEWTNPDQILTELAATQGDQLAAYNKPIVERLESAVTIEQLQLERSADRDVTISAQVASQDGIKDYTAMVRLYHNDQLMGAVKVQGKNPGTELRQATWTEQVTLFGDGAEFPTDVTVELELESAVFSDGSVLRRARSYAEIQ